MKRFFSSIRIKLILLILFVIIPIATFTIYTDMIARKETAAYVQKQVQRFVELAAHDEAQLINATRQFLITLAHTPQVRGRDPVVCTLFLKDLIKQFQWYLNIGVIRPDGNLYCSALPFKSRVNLSNRAYFQQALENFDFAIGGYQVGRITGRPSVNFAYPVLNADGSVKAVVFAALDIAWLNYKFEQKIAGALPEGSTLTKIDSNGTVLARYPDAERWLGKKYTILKKTALDTIFRQKNGIFEDYGHDGALRLYAFTPMFGDMVKGDIYVILSIPKNAVFARADRLFTINLILMAAVLLITISLALVGSEMFILRGINALIKTSGRIAEGDLGARTGLPHYSGEIGQLARSFDGMVEVIQKKQAEISKLSHAIEQSPVSVVITDVGGNIEYVNPKFVEITGYTFEEVVDKNPRILKSGKTPPEEYKRLWGAITSGETWRGVLHNRKKNGELFYESAVISPVKNMEGVITHFIGIKEDITELKKLQEQLLHAQKMEALGTFSGGIAHDFNNMLTAIIGFGGLMQMNMEEDDPNRAHLKEILNAGERATHLTQSLLAFSRKQIIDPSPQNLNEIIKGVEKFLRRIIGEDIELKIVLSDNDLTVLADSGQIEQVLMNLATNARDAMPDGGVLIIETGLVELDEEYMKTHAIEKPGMYALISVTDAGTGMDEKTKERIFEPYFTTKETGKGTGLGLSIVYGIVRQHDGYINCYSESGKGTTFKIYLPLAKLGIEGEKSVISLPPARGTETILLAEEDAAVRRFTKKTLEQWGYEVIETEDGEDAIKVFNENRDKIQLLVSDVIMPKMNGKEAYEGIKKIKPDIKAVFMSGYTANIIHKKGVLEEGINFISKPVSPNELLRKVREVLDGKI